jgi:osmotically-inducible protein OsmY
MIKAFHRTGLVLVLVGATLVGVSGCIPLVIGGAMTSAMVVSDRRTPGTVVEDEGIELKASARIRDNIGERVHINVTSYNRQVLLTGEAPTADDKKLVERVVSSVENVRNIVNEIQIAGVSTLTQRSSDALVSGRVKAGLVDAKDLLANAFKIVTEHGTTYMMGRVTQREATRATEVISATSGVQKVVRILEIISEEELARNLPQQTPSTSSKR